MIFSSKACGTGCVPELLSARECNLVGRDGAGGGQENEKLVAGEEVGTGHAGGQFGICTSRNRT